MIKPISKPLSQLQAEYTVVVVGSGYGAGVAASRLARAGQTVCVLERGKEILPGQYPVNMADSQGAMQADTSRGKLGSPYGMFNVHVNPDMMAVVGCGLGGLQHPGPRSGATPCPGAAADLLHTPAQPVSAPP